VQLTALETSRVAKANASAAWLDALSIAERAAQAAVSHLLASRSRLPMAFLSRRTPQQMAAQITEEAHDLMRGEIHRSFTHHTVIGRHEGGMRPPIDTGPVWLIDALDGLGAYANDKPPWAVSIALAVHGKLRLAVVIDGQTLESYRALSGLGIQVDRLPAARAETTMPLEHTAGPPSIALRRVASAQPRALSLNDGSGPSVRQRFAEAQAATIFPTPGSARMAAFSHEFGRAIKAFKTMQRTTAASLGLAQVATGRLDAFWAHDQDPCDLAAGMLLVQEAGAELRARDGLPLLSSRSISACTPTLAYDFHSLLAGV
jgi:myo-inositol-1(or 4)-monophosphatase